MADIVMHRYHDEATWMRAWDNRNLVYHVAKDVRKYHRWLDPDEVFAAGLEGLCRAYEGFDASRKQIGTRYLVRSIRRAIIWEIRQIREMIHVPMYAREEGIPVDDTPPYELTDPLRDDDDNEEERTVWARKIVHEALDAITPKQSHAVKVCHGIHPYESMTDRTGDIAEVTGVSAGTLCHRRDSGMRAIRSYLTKRHPASVGYVAPVTQCRH